MAGVKKMLECSYLVIRLFARARSLPMGPFLRIPSI